MKRSEAVEQRLEGDTALGDLDRFRRAGRLPSSLVSSATPPCASEKTWNPPESVITARSQAHEAVQAAEGGDPILTRRQVQVEGVLPKTSS